MVKSISRDKNKIRTFGNKDFLWNKAVVHFNFIRVSGKLPEALSELNDIIQKEILAK